MGIDLKDPTISAITKCSTMLPSFEGRLTQIFTHDASDMCYDIIKELNTIQKTPLLSSLQYLRSKNKYATDAAIQEKLTKEIAEKEIMLKTLDLYPDENIKTLKEKCLKDIRLGNIVAKILELNTKCLSNVDSLLNLVSTIINPETPSANPDAVSYNLDNLTRVTKFIDDQFKAFKTISTNYNKFLRPIGNTAYIGLNSWLSLYGGKVKLKNPWE